VRSPPGEPRRVGYLYVLPALLVALGFVVWPLLHGAWLSLFHWDGETLGTWAGAANYTEAIADPKLRGGFAHALTLVFFYAVLPCFLALVLVAAMSRTRPRGLGFFRTVLFLPQVVAMVAVAVVWRWIYSSDGPVNTTLRWLGLDSLTRGWLGDFTWALPSVGLVGTWIEVGLAMVLFLAGVQKIPGELYDAARVDGAGPVREFFAITLPGLRRELAVALTLTTAAALRNFDLIFMLTKGGPGDATRVPAYEVYYRVFETAEVGLACAIGIIIAALILALTVVITRLAEGPVR
jgi:raffinose/stachyose/melibiose transport system permease protein